MQGNPEKMVYSEHISSVHNTRLYLQLKSEAVLKMFVQRKNEGLTFPHMANSPSVSSHPYVKA
jgi:hypothetical protein